MHVMTIVVMLLGAVSAVTAMASAASRKVPVPVRVKRDPR